MSGERDLERGAPPPQRILPWEECLNVRDLGGYPAAGGRQTAWGAVVRSDNLALLNQAGQQALIDYGIRSIVDLRKPDEVAMHPNPFAAPSARGIVYTNISLVDPAALSPEFTTLANDYKNLLGHFQSAIGSIIGVIADAPDGGVLVHCMGGKDRTGIISALLLELTGVPRHVIGDDYALTAECLRSQDEVWLEHGPGDRAWRERELVKYAPLPEVMIEVLEYLDEQYDGVEWYLLAAGVTPEQVSRLRRRLMPGQLD